MDDQVVWDDASLININTDTPSSTSGDVNRSGSVLRIGSNSSIVYKYNYGTTGKLVKSNKLRFDIKTSVSDTNIKTRYNELFYVLVKIRYWREKEDEQSVFEEGYWDICRLYPYFISEKDGYNQYLILEIQNNYICNLEIHFIVNEIENSIITINNPKINKSISVNEAISGFSKGGDQLKSIDTYENGMVAYYVDEDQPITLKVDEVVEDVSYLINVSDRYNFTLVLHAGDMPWDR